jgi:hypothetical protein
MERDVMDVIEQDTNKMDVEVSLKTISVLDTIEPAGHLDQMFRQTRIHHAQLSQMADVKASMMLTLASLIITFSIGYLNDPVLRWPTVIMICFCVVTILSAAYAVMPKLNLRNRPKMSDPNFNILFFGSFFNMDYEEYGGIMNEVLHDSTLAYEAQLREVYEMGIYLGRMKYRYIRIAYTSFLLGVILSVVMVVVTQLVNWVAS